MTSEYRIEVSLPAEFGHQEITDQVAAWVQASGVRTGVVTVQAVGSTSGITTIEYESGAVADLVWAQGDWQLLFDEPAMDMRGLAPTDTYLVWGPQ